MTQKIFSTKKCLKKKYSNRKKGHGQVMSDLLMVDRKKSDQSVWSCIFSRFDWQSFAQSSRKTFFWLLLWCKFCNSRFKAMQSSFGVCCFFALHGTAKNYGGGTAAKHTNAFGLPVFRYLEISSNKRRFWKYSYVPNDRACTLIKTLSTLHAYSNLEKWKAYFFLTDKTFHSAILPVLK